MWWLYRNGHVVPLSEFWQQGEEKKQIPKPEQNYEQEIRCLDSAVHLLRLPRVATNVKPNVTTMYEWTEGA